MTNTERAAKTAARQAARSPLTTSVELAAPANKAPSAAATATATAAAAARAAAVAAANPATSSPADANASAAPGAPPARPVFDLRTVPPLDIDALASGLELAPDAAAAAMAEFDVAIAHSMGLHMTAAAAPPPPPRSPTANGIAPDRRSAAQDAKPEQAAPSPVAVIQARFARDAPSATHHRAGGRDDTNRSLNY